MPASQPSPGAALFGGKRFWAFAIGISVIWGFVSCSNGENEKADAARESARVAALATEETAVLECSSSMREMYEGPGFKVISLTTVGRSSLNYKVDAVIQRQSPLNKKLFTTTERCDVVWSYLADAWEVRRTMTVR